MRCSVFIATSLDGYIARPDGNIDWLVAPHPLIPPEEDFGFAAFFQTVDALVMGRGTLEKVLTLPDWAYGDKPLFVLSSQWKTLPAGIPPTVRLLQGEPTDIIDCLSAEGFQHLYVDGGVTIQRFLAADRIDEMTITTIPVLLGAGLPLFGQLSTDRTWELLSSQSYACGYVQSRYHRS